MADVPLFELAVKTAWVFTSFLYPMCAASATLNLLTSTRIARETDVRVAQLSALEDQSFRNNS